MLTIILQTTDTGYGNREVCRAYSCVRHRIWECGQARQDGLQRCVCRMACPWFVKEEIPHGTIRRRGLRVQRCITVNAVWDTQAGGCTKVSSSGIWYGKGGSGVQNHYRTTPSTPNRAFRYGSVEVAGELITSDACPEKLTIVRRAASDKRSCTKYEMRFGFVSYKITEGS